MSNYAPRAVFRFRVLPVLYVVCISDHNLIYHGIPYLHSAVHGDERAWRGGKITYLHVVAKLDEGVACNPKSARPQSRTSPGDRGGDSVLIRAEL